MREGEFVDLFQDLFIHFGKIIISKKAIKNERGFKFGKVAKVQFAHGTALQKSIESGSLFVSPVNLSSLLMLFYYLAPCKMTPS